MTRSTRPLLSALLLGLLSGGPTAAHAAIQPASARPSFGSIQLSGSGSTGDASAFSVTNTAGTTRTLQSWTDAVASLQAGTGATGAAALAIGTVSAVPYGTSPSASIGNGLLNLALEQGAPGAAPALSVGAVSTLAPGASATVSATATGSNAYALNFGLPQGLPATGSATTDGMSIVRAASGALSAVNLAGGADYITVPAGTASPIGTPSAVANDMPASGTMVIDLTALVGAWPASGAYAQLFGKWRSGASSANGEFTVFLASNGAIVTGFYTPGSGAYQALPSLGTFPTGVKGTLSVAYDFSSAAIADHGVAVAAGTASALWSTDGATWTVLGTVSVSAAPAGFARLGTASAPLTIGDFTASLPMTVYGLTATDGAGNLLARADVADANTGTVPTDAAGNVWSIAASLAVTPAGLRNLAPPATSTALGMIKVGADGSVAVASDGTLTANLANALVQPVVAPWTGLARSPCARGHDLYLASDFGTTGAGYGQTIGTRYGATLAAVAGTTMTDCAGNTYQPFAWLLDGTYHGGVSWVIQPQPSQDWIADGIVTVAAGAGAAAVTLSGTAGIAPGMSFYDSGAGTIVGTVQAVRNEVVMSTASLATVVAAGDTVMDGVTRQTAVVQSVSGTSYTLVGSAALFIAGHTLVDTNSGAVGQIGAVAPPSVSFTAGITAAITAGDFFVAQITTTASAPGSTSSPTIAVASAADIVAGSGVYDATSAKPVGLVASLSGKTVTLAANASAAIASGDLLAFYNPSVLNWTEVCARCGYPSGASSRIAYFGNPQHASFYPEIGDLIADVSNATPCIASGTTITAIDKDPHDVTYGQVTLSTGTAADCVGGTRFQVRVPDSAVAGLDVDWFGVQSAIYAATNSASTRNALGGAASERVIRLPDAEIYPLRPIFAYSYSSNPNNHVLLEGSGLTVLNPYVDFGTGKCAISEGSNGGVSQYGDGVIFRDFTVVGPSASGGVGTDPSADSGLCMGAGDSATNVTIQGFHAGFALQGDHTMLYNSAASGNYYGVYFLPDVGSIGNQRFENDVFVANRFASFGFAASNQFDSGTVLDTHIGFEPVGWFKEAPGFFDPYVAGNGFITNSSLFDNWWEATGNGAILDASETAILGGDLFAGAETNNDFQYAGDALANMYPGGHAEATVHVGVLSNNRWIGATVLSDYADVTKDIVDVVGACSGNLFIGAEAFVGGGSAAKPAMECGSDGGQNAFTGAWNGAFHAADATITVGMPVAIDANGAVVSFSSSAPGYVGAAGGASANVQTACASGQNQMCPVIRSGTRVPFLEDTTNNTGTVSPGTMLTPASTGFTATNSFPSEVGVVGFGHPGGDQIGFMDLGR